MNLIDEIRDHWGWAGLHPVEVIGENDFGNLIIKDIAGKYWRITPEECQCEVVANNKSELDALLSHQEFLHDWHMDTLVEVARERCGPLMEGRKYGLKIPSALGGEYVGDNLATAPLIELIRFSGDIARQIHNLPDGTPISLKLTK